MMFVKVFFSIILPMLTLYGWVLTAQCKGTSKELYAWAYQLSIQAVWWTSAIMIMDWWRWSNTVLFTVYFMYRVVQCIVRKHRANKMLPKLAAVGL